MKFVLTVLIITQGEPQGEVDLLCEFPTPEDALQGMVQLMAANSILYTHLLVRPIWDQTPSGSLARLAETFPPGTVVQPTAVKKYTREIPADIKNDPDAIFHVVCSRPHNPPPKTGRVGLHEDTTVH